MTVNLLKNNFSRGEFSPRAYSRADTEMYGGGCEKCRNFIAKPHGGLSRRPGTRFAGLAKLFNQDAAFIEFVYSSTGDAYLLEFGHQYIRIWTQGGQLSGDDHAITGVTQANPGVVTYTGTDPANGDHVLITGVTGMVELNNRRFTVANVNAGANTFQLSGVNTTSYGAFSAGGVWSSPIEIPTGYSASEVAAIQFVQVGNVVYLAHENHAPAQLTRNSHTSWTLADSELVDGPYQPINDTTTTVTSSAALDLGTTTTLTFSGLDGINGGDGFLATDVGRHIRVRATGSPAIWVYGIIDAVTDTDEIDVEWLRGLTADGPSGGGTCTDSASWRLGAFSDTTGYPGCVETFEGRLVWARTASEPRTVFMSRNGLPLDYAPSNGDSVVTADHGLSLAILAGRADRILWLNDAPRLQIGTSSGIRTLGASDTQQAIGPTNISQRLEVTYGASEVPPAQIGSTSLYASKFGLSLRNLAYSYEQNGLIAPNISIISEHLFDSPIKKIRVTEQPDQVAWILKTDGTLVGLTYDREQSVSAFHRHDFGDDTIVKDIGVIPGATRDELWAIIERTTADGVVRSVEYLEAEFALGGELEDAYYVDFGTTYSGAATNTVSGLWHLRGQSVEVLANGAVLPEMVVSATGRLTFPDGKTYTKAHIGLAIVSEVKALRPPYQQNDGWALGRRQNIGKIITDVVDSGPISIGTMLSHTPISYRQSTEAFGTPPALRNGSYHVPVEDRWQGGGQAYGTISLPLPCYLRSWVISLATEEQ